MKKYLFSAVVIIGVLFSCNTNRSDHNESRRMDTTGSDTLSDTSDLNQPMFKNENPGTESPPDTTR